MPPNLDDVSEVKITCTPKAGMASPIVRNYTITDNIRNKQKQSDVYVEFGCSPYFRLYKNVDIKGNGKFFSKQSINGYEYN